MNFKCLVKITCVLSLYFLLSNCANVVKPTGGDKDITPPNVLDTYPPNKSVNFAGKTILIKFDEYIVLNNIQNNVIISPFLDCQPTYKIKGRSLEIDLSACTLADNTTYTINLSKGIKDNTEGNVLRQYNYVFSTGAYLDSLFIKGQVIKAENNETVKEVVVALYKDQSDTAFTTNKPYYYTITDGNGNYQLENLAAGYYRLYALLDQNNSLTYDQPGESIAFIDSLIEVKNDSNNYYVLNLFEADQPIKLLEATTPHPGKVIFNFSKPSPYNDVKRLDQVEKGVIEKMEYSIHKDTIIYWTTDYYQESLEFLIYDSSKIIDTVSVDMLALPKDKSIEEASPLQISVPSNNIAFYQPVDLIFSHPIAGANLEKIKVSEDSVANTIKTKISLVEPLNKKLKIDYNWKQEKEYWITIPANTFTDIFNIQNDSLVFRLKTKAKEDYGALNISFKMDSLSKVNYYFQLIQNNAIVKSAVLHKSTQLNYKYLSPGLYRIKVIIDKNDNKQWDTGNWKKRLQPEKIINYPEEIEIREDWEVEVEMNMKNTYK